jgi:serine/threonine-protein kinase
MTTEEQTPRAGPGAPVLAGALEEELRQLELSVARVWQLLGLFGVLLAIGFAVARTTPVGVYGGLAALPYLAYYTVLRWLLQRGRSGPGLGFVTTLVDATIPWTFMLAVFMAEGAGHALGSWVPPLLFAAILIASVARLRWGEPLVAGVVGGIMHSTLFFSGFQEALPDYLVGETVYQPLSQITRSISFVVGGGLGSLVSLALRRAIRRAEGTMREQDLFGKYRLLERIASGGMGSVHRAVYCPEGGFEREVAIKRMHPHLAEEPKIVEAFRREAALCSRLLHPNVVQVLDFGSIGETYFLAMEYVDGLTLRALMRRARAAGMVIPPELTAHIGRALLSGLAYAHGGAHDTDGRTLRIVHRDLCPANVLLSRHGDVKIADFGVAKALRDAASLQTRTIAGHVAYLAPEQARGEALDPRCDVYAVGVILWEMLCGEPMFERPTEAETLRAIADSETPAPSARNPALDPAWDDVVLRATAQSLDERFRDATEMMATLSALADAQGGPWDDELALLVQDLAELPEPEEAGEPGPAGDGQDE